MKLYLRQSKNSGQNGEKKLNQLEKIAVERWYNPASFATLVKCGLHHFADTCECGSGKASYLRLVDNNG